MFGYLTCVSSVYGKEVMVKIRKWRPFLTPSWILKNASKGFPGTFYQWFYTYSWTYPEKISLLPIMSTFWALWANTTGLLWKLLQIGTIFHCKSNLTTIVVSVFQKVNWVYHSGNYSSNPKWWWNSDPALEPQVNSYCYNPSWSFQMSCKPSFRVDSDEWNRREPWRCSAYI